MPNHCFVINCNFSDHNEMKILNEYRLKPKSFKAPKVSEIVHWHNCYYESNGNYWIRYAYRILNYFSRNSPENFSQTSRQFHTIFKSNLGRCDCVVIDRSLTSLVKLHKNLFVNHTFYSSLILFFILCGDLVFLT